MIGKYNMHFEISERKVLLRIFDVVWVLLTLYLVGLLFSFEYFRISSEFWNWCFVLAIYLSVFSSIFELYDLQKASQFQTVLKNVVLTTSVTVLFFLLTPIFTPVLPENRLQIIYFYLAIITALLLWRYTYIALVTSPRFYKRVLVIGDASYVDLASDQLKKADPNYNVIGFINTSGHDEEENHPDLNNAIIEFASENLKATLKQNNINEILIASSRVEGGMLPIYEQLIELMKLDFPVRDYNQVYEEKTHRIPVQHMEKDFYKFFPFSRRNQSKFYLSFHRLADIVISIIGISIGAFLILLVLLGNLLGNRGRLFYFQERVGKNGKRFNIVKFRTMICDAEPHGAQWAEKNDARATRFGKFLRRSRLDEFPQFYNILKGEMSLIGPRPERPVFVEKLSKEFHYYDTRHVIKPGLTGWAQVMIDYGNSHEDSLEKLQFDLYYIKHRNIFMDITILTKTLSTIIFYRGQ